MKKILYLIMLLFIINNVKADVVLPDGIFKSFLVYQYPSCFYTDANQVQWLNTSCSEIMNEDSLDLSHSTPGTGVYLDLEGLQYFTSLKYLNCTYGDLVSSPPLPASLIKLVIVNALNNQPYGSFPPNFLPNGLRYLDMNYNYMLSPPSWPDSLRYLNCSYNSIGTLPALPPFLDTLICKSQEIYSGNNNILTSLPNLPTTLKYLDCSNNNLSGLPALPASLTYLDCSEQYSRPTLQTFDFHLAALPALPSGLLTLKCRGNRLSVLPLLPLSLLYLDCSMTRKFLGDLGELNPSPNSIVYEGIDTLLPLPPSLQYLNCSYNKISNLPPLPASITYLNCGFNIYSGFAGVGGNEQTGGINSLAPLPPQLDTLNIEGTPVFCIPRIPASLTSLVIGTTIQCLPNPGNYTVSGYNIFYPPPFCDMFTNYFGCQYTGLVSGNIYYDNNSNGIKDPGENYRSNVEVQLSNGQYGYTSDSGYYALAADPGNYTLTVVEPTLYAAIPASINYSLASFDTVVHAMIALQPTVTRDSILISLIPLNVPRVGFNHIYNVTYTNVGTTNISPSVRLNYDNTRLTYIESSNAAVVNNSNHLDLTETNLIPGTQHNFLATFVVHPDAVLGDSLHTNITATAGTCTANDTVQLQIRGAYDPNDKSATPSLTLPEVAAGTYINYTVRFQNTGTYLASKVIVTDTLSGFLDPSTFKLVGTSHNCKTTRTGNKLAFEFLNINLPDSNVNEPGSHGFIRFAVKPLTSVPLNTVIPNKASIYFDFNQPVLTNTANTTIVLPGEVTPTPVTTLSFTAVADANNNALLNWNTVNEFNISSFDIEQSIDDILFNKIGSTSAHGMGDNAYSYNTIIVADIVYYRIKMINIDGSSTYSNVIPVMKNKQSESIQVLSNPATNTLSLIINDDALVNTNATIINELGAVVKRFTLKSGLQNINVSNLSTGVYYLKTIATTKKIMINH